MITIVQSPTPQVPDQNIGIVNLVLIACILSVSFYGFYFATKLYRKMHSNTHDNHHIRFNTALN